MKLSRRILGRAVVAHGALAAVARGTLAAVALVALTGCTGTKFEKVAPRDVNPAQRAFAEKWGTATLTAWANKEYPQAGQEATRDFRGAHNNAKLQKTAYDYVKGKVGGFKSMAFFEVRRSVPPKHTIYRFHGDFELGEAEVRVVLDKDGKIDGFFIKPWREEMK